MAVKPYLLPFCDKCGRPWLPEDWTTEDDPRVYEKERRAKGETPMRCGRCKSYGWDRNFVGDRRFKATD